MRACTASSPARQDSISSLVVMMPSISVVSEGIRCILYLSL